MQPSQQICLTAERGAAPSESSSHKPRTSPRRSSAARIVGDSVGPSYHASRCRRRCHRFCATWTSSVHGPMPASSCYKQSRTRRRRSHRSAGDVRERCSPANRDKYGPGRPENRPTRVDPRLPTIGHVAPRVHAGPADFALGREDLAAAVGNSSRLAKGVRTPVCAREGWPPSASDCRQSQS